MRLIGSKVLPALLLVLALLLFLQVRRDYSPEERSSSMGAANDLHGVNDDPVGSGRSKPTKVSERPEHQAVDDKIPVAEPVQGQPGFVYHPVTGKIVDVRGVPAGLAVTQGGSAMFVIPKMGYVITSEAFNKAVWGKDGGLPGKSVGFGAFRDGAVRIVSCSPVMWETKWDDGSPYVPDEASEKLDESLE